MSDPTRFIRACTDDTSVLTDFLRWIETQRMQAVEQCAKNTVDAEIYRLQGEARALKRIATLVAQMMRMKGEIEDDERRVRRIR